MKIIKRNGSEAIFEPEKIENAITKANEAAEGKPELIPEQVHAIAAIIEHFRSRKYRSLSRPSL